jgi:hypothetical protein
MKKYVAYYKANNDIEEFETFEKAENWLQECYREDAVEGYSEESCSQGDFIAHITHRSMFVQTDSKDKYKWCKDKHGYFNEDGEEWYSEYDAVGEIQLLKVK